MLKLLYFCWIQCATLAVSVNNNTTNNRNGSKIGLYWIALHEKLFFVTHKMKIALILIDIKLKWVNMNSENKIIICKLKMHSDQSSIVWNCHYTRIKFAFSSNWHRFGSRMHACIQCELIGSNNLNFVLLLLSSFSVDVVAVFCELQTTNYVHCALY